MKGTHLLLDLGNTRLKWALARDGALVQAPAALSWPGSALPLSDWQALRPETVALASVAPPAATAALEDALCTLGTPVHRVQTQVQWRGLRCGYPRPERLGVDRWLALVAAYCRSPDRACIVVSAGTALTVDVLDPDGAHRGGVIAPGLSTMRAGLITAAPALARHEGGVAASGPASDSADAIASGCLQAALGVIERHARDATGAPRQVLLAGGDAGVLAPHLAGPVELAPALVLEGLARWIQFSAAATAPR
jgi:type III pantothenate kinase